MYDCFLPPEEEFRALPELHMIYRPPPATK